MAFQVEDNVTRYTPLLNAYVLLFVINLKTRRGYSFCFPEMRLAFLGEKDDIPLAINSVIITKQLGALTDYIGIDLTKPLGLSNPFLRQQPVGLKKGIKDIGGYRLFQRVQKLNRGASRSDVYMATNGKKIIFLRDSQRTPHNEIFSSKLASFVSKTNFSSERLFGNGLTGSRKLLAYMTSMIDDKVQSQIQTLANSSPPKFFPGMGLIDEVLNFVNEKDPNGENYGVSSLDKHSCFFSKIDFDSCDVINPSEEYETNRCTGSGIYSQDNASLIRNGIDYICEKFYTRIKLCILTPEFYAALNTKVNFDAENLKRVIVELTRRREIALRLMFLDSNLRNFLIKDQNILNRIGQEATCYIQTHFETETRPVVLHSISRSIQEMRQLIKDKSGIYLEFENITFLDESINELKVR